MQELTPRQVVKALDRYIIGQEDAKRAVAIAVRNRWRRLRLPPDLAEDVAPKNILMIGPTGVGKTEIARRLAQLINAPFVKVEATKFTEVGYHGRDVDGIVRDLVERAVTLERAEAAKSVRERAEKLAEDHILDQLLPASGQLDRGDPEQGERRQRTREKLRSQLQAGGLAERTIEVTISERAVPGHVMTNMGLDQMGPEFEQFMERVMPPRSRRQRLPLPEAIELLAQQETDRLIDQDTLHASAIRRTEEAGSSFSTSSTRSAAVRSVRLPGRTCPAPACNGICCRWWKARRSARVTGWCVRITFCSSRPGRSHSLARAT